MSLLFDISPDDVPDKPRKGGKRQDATKSPSDTEPEFRVEYVARELKIIGKLDGKHTCADDRCGGNAHDVIDRQWGEWLLGCAFCGTCQWVEAPEEAVELVKEEFRLHDGRFAGMTLDEAAGKDRGLEYIRFAAKSHKRDVVRDACRKWLDLRGLSS